MTLTEMVIARWQPCGYSPQSHWLYEFSVQCVWGDIAILARIHRFLFAPVSVFEANRERSDRFWLSHMAMRWCRNGLGFCGVAGSTRLVSPQQTNQDLVINQQQQQTKNTVFLMPHGVALRISTQQTDTLSIYRARPASRNTRGDVWHTQRWLQNSS